MQFMVTAYDYTDSEALERRMANREAHLAGARKLIKAGNFISGGAILNDAGNMIGSTLHLAFEDRSALEACLNADPYVSGKVWEHIDIRAVKLVPIG